MRWRATATFVGPGRFQGFAPNGERIAIEGCDVLEVVDDLIVANTAYVDSGDVARQLGFLPPAGSQAERRLTALANARTAVAQGAVRRRAARRSPPASGCCAAAWRGTMNVYLIEDEGGVTVYDAGSQQMSGAIRAAGGPASAASAGSSSATPTATTAAAPPGSRRRSTAIRSSARLRSRPRRTATTGT